MGLSPFSAKNKHLADLLGMYWSPSMYLLGMGFTPDG